MHAIHDVWLPCKLVFVYHIRVIRNRCQAISIYDLPKEITNLLTDKRFKFYIVFKVR
jgi:hypothetical protein